jgi:hypothetical protein
MRGIDHLVLPATTLMLARSRLAGLGFTVAPDARHPFGTGNCCVFFANGTYLEPITILDRQAADVAAAEGAYFVRRLKRFTERHGEGFAMLAVRSDDAGSDRAAFERAGFGAGPIFEFRRSTAMPDGREKEIGVALAFAATPAAPDATLFACQHFAREVLFQPAYLEHPNGAVGVRAVAAVARDPAAFRGYLSAVVGLNEDGSASAGDPISAAGPIAVFTPEDFKARYGTDAPNPRTGLFFAGIEIQVADLDVALGFAGPTATRHEGRIVVPPAPGLGATLAFTKGTDDETK